MKTSTKTVCTSIHNKLAPLSNCGGSPPASACKSAKDTAWRIPRAKDMSDMAKGAIKPAPGQFVLQDVLQYRPALHAQSNGHPPQDQPDRSPDTRARESVRSAAAP